MSRFDEEPDGDPHGECAAEIRRLAAENKVLRDALGFIEQMSIEFKNDHVPRTMGDIARAALTKEATK
jgi:hypothetical protein